MSRTRSAWREVTADRLVLLFAALVLVLAAASAEDPGSADAPRGLDAVAGLILVACVVVIVAGRRAPSLAAVAVLGLSFLWYGLGYTSGLINVMSLAAFFQLGTSADGRRTLLVTGGSVVAIVLNIAAFTDDSVWSALTAAGYLVMAVLFGELIRSRGLLLEHYSARAEQARRDAERRVAEERLRIAQDVHDLLAHSVSVMTVQAGVAADALDRDTVAARSALGAIRAAGREAMREVRSTVSVLREGGDASRGAPAPRLAQLPELIDVARSQGVEATLERRLSGRPIPELVELTAYRVVQEGLTNVVRHAGASSATVTVAEEPSELVVEVADDGRGGPDGAVGFGLRGMAERVGSLGGELRHGSGRGGGWTVRASIPLRRG